jgi:hypothetical protein
MKKLTSIRWWQTDILVLGISVCLLTAFLVGWGEPVLGADHTGIATVIGIAGTRIMSNSTVIGARATISS